MKMCRETPNLVKIGQKSVAVYMKSSSTRFVVAGDIISP